MKNRWLPYLVIALATCIQLVLIFQPLRFLLVNILPDDTFYYFQIARNIVAGHGSMFDALHPTNGYHPLWMLILLPIYALFSSGGVLDVQPIYVALSVCVLLNIGSVVLLYRLLRRITSHVGVLSLGLAAWCLNPFILYETVNGLETALALFLLVLFTQTALKAIESGRKIDMVLTGVVAGLLVLARLDMAAYVIAFAVFLLVRDGIVKGIRTGLPAAIPAMLLVACWVLYNYYAFGMLLTSASGGNILVNHTLVTQDNGSSLWVRIKAPLYMLYTYGKSVLLRTGAFWLPLAVFGGLVFWWRRNAYQLPKRDSALTFALALFGGFVLLFVLNAGVRFTGRTWYFISANLFLAASVVWLLSASHMEMLRTKKALLLISIALIISYGISWKTTLYNQMPNQQGMYEMAGWLSKELPAGTKVGVFNAGIVGYFSTVQVVNLDGLVNNSAYEAMRSHSLWAYIGNEHLSYIADYPLYITYRYRSFFGIPNVLDHLTPLHDIETPGASRGNTLVLYSVAQP